MTQKTEEDPFVICDTVSVYPYEIFLLIDILARFVVDRFRRLNILALFVQISVFIEYFYLTFEICWKGLKIYAINFLA